MHYPRAVCQCQMVHCGEKGRYSLTSVAVSEGRKVRPQVDSCLCNFVALISIFHVYGSSELLTCT